MNTDTVTVRADVPMDVVMRYLRMRGELPERTDCLFVVDRHDRYLGALPLTRLLTSEPEALASTGMKPEQLIAFAFQELAGKADKIGQLNISPDLLRELLDKPARK